MSLKQFNLIEEFAQKEHDAINFSQENSIEKLPLTSIQKVCVVEYLAGILFDILLKLDVSDGHCKIYDPLRIEGNIAHSYVFDLEDGGRRHQFNNLKHLQDMLVAEVIECIQQAWDEK